MPKPPQEQPNDVANNATRLERLIRLLDQEDAGRSHSAGLELVRLSAVEPLLHALATGTPAQRKAAAFLVGRVNDRNGNAESRIVESLLQALGDEEPKVRKNAAVSLGQLGSATASAALRTALDGENIPWVRTSLVLALGKVGGPTAWAALAANEPRTPEEADATRRALERLLPNESTVRWRSDGQVTVPIVAYVPVGFEDVAASEMEEQGLGSPRMLRPGILPLPEGVSPAGHLAGLRCAFDLRVLLGTGPSLAATQPSDMPQQMTEILRACTALDNLDDYFVNTDPPFRYRFALVGRRLARRWFIETLSAVRSKLEDKGLADSPSRYQGQLIVEIDETCTTVWLVPTFEPDRRFAYRRRDVGASINPVIGACLARLVYRPESKRVLDPTCGSGTLLIERALLDKQTTLTGLDLSPTAIEAAHTNVASAKLEGRIRIKRGNACKIDLWPLVDEVIANLPFGLRSRRQDRDLEALYAAVVSGLKEVLRPGGRAVLYTANSRALDAALVRGRGYLCRKDQRYVDSGGIRVWVYVLERL